MAGRRALAMLTAALAVPLFPACSSLSAASTDGQLRVVASTDVYGDIALAVAGGHAEVSSLIDDPAQDPHSYQAGARSELAVARADVLIENGGGYDDFIDHMRTASGNTDATVINVVRLSGKSAPPGGELNEHVWYDLPTMARFAHRLADVLSAKDLADRAAFRANATRFVSGLDGLERDEGAVRARYAGTGVAITEPVPLYLLQACGLVNRTPAQFSGAVEADTGVSVVVLQHTLELFSTHAVAALVYNSQTSGAETTRVRAAARANGIPAVAVTETLPSGSHYLGWMSANLAAIRAAVS